jgi:glycosyltransferase involved in cell wall biosynthesis
VSFISVIIATKGRGGAVTGTVRSVLANTHPHFEIVVVDQNGDDAVATALALAADDSRVRCVPSASRGVSAARNAGIATARGDVIAITDDDCEVAADWLASIDAAFARDRSIGVVFGNVLAGRHDPTAGFVTSYVRATPSVATRIREKHRVQGISACMALRADVCRHLGGFDEMLGAGAPLGSGAETDVTVRALLAGYAVFETPDVRVVHHGFRNWSDGERLVARYLFGTGAVVAKHVKCGHLSILGVLVPLATQWARGRSAVSVGRAYRWLKLRAFARGLIAGTRAPVRRSSSMFSVV